MASHSAIITRLLVLILAITVRQTAAVNGKASHYGGNLSGGNCMLTSYTIPAGTFGTAIAISNYDNSNMCGVCLNVKGPSGSMKVMVRTFLSGISVLGRMSLHTTNDKFAKMLTAMKCLLGR